MTEANEQKNNHFKSLTIERLQEIPTVKDELSKSSFQLSNPSLLIDHSLEIISNLPEFWASGDYDHKPKRPNYRSCCFLSMHLCLKQIEAIASGHNEAT